MYDIALTVPILDRVGRLERLLNSASGLVDHVVVADQGKDLERKQEIYDADWWGFDLEVLDLEYDAGLGTSRDKGYKAAKGSAEYILVADPDHELTDHGVNTLHSQLEAAPEYGGLAGNLVEPTEGRVWQSAKDFVVRNNYLVRTSKIDKEFDMIAGAPVAQWDFLPYPTLYRTECLEDYSWDPRYPRTRVHVDFYVGHWRNTDWKFGVNPEVSFRHYPGGDEEYDEMREDEEKYRIAKRQFREKWPYKKLIGHTGHKYWFTTDD